MGQINKFFEEEGVDAKTFWTIYLGVKRMYRKLGYTFNRKEFVMHLCAVMAFLMKEDKKIK
jgi:hypothetical protein